MSRLIYSECNEYVLAEIDGDWYPFSRVVKDIVSDSDEEFLQGTEDALRAGTPLLGSSYQDEVREAKEAGIIFPEEEKSE